VTRTVLAFVLALALAPAPATFRPPAVPLVAHDPYFSVWSMADRLTDDPTRHWTGSLQTLTGLVRIDGKPFRIMGRDPRAIPALPQQSLDVLPTRTVYRFAGAGVALTLTFLTPALPRDLDVYSRPATYIDWRIVSADGAAHQVSVYFDASSDLAVNTTDQRVLLSRYRLGDLDVLRAGSQQQPILEKYGDNLRIDWGYLYLVGSQAGGTSATGERGPLSEAFVRDGRLPDADDLEVQQSTRRRNLVLARALDLGSVAATPVSRHVVLAYDDLFSIEYFQRRLRPYWRRNGDGPAEMLRKAWQEYDSLAQRSAAFDKRLMDDLVRVGGEEYARLASLAYRQTAAAHKLTVDMDGTPLLFSKENFSNGCIDTVDVTYPSSPFFLLFNPDLLRAQLRPVLDYAASGRWKFPFAPHDLGTYPQANGQVYGGGERTEENQMPVEESGNMLILLAALAKIDGNASFAERYWPIVTRWAEYLKAKGMDPENQLSTDDFAGHLAHNANLSAKAILALESYALLADMTRHAGDAQTYRAAARDFAKQWVQMAADGDHYKLAFDKPGTWSQKYNLVWDKVLGFNLFPREVAQKELAFYRTHQNAYGLPLDNRATYTKLDWILWTATLADSRADFDALVAPAYRFANESPSRVPLTDWYDTVDAKQRGFQARSVVGGLFIKMLSDPEVWRTWRSQ
jgi:glutaminase A-like protein/uncharacterized protein DUF5127/uncharacterized protein DUF4964